MSSDMPKVALIDDMSVANVGFLIENLGKDAGELQYLRELTQNSIEAIRARGGVDGRIEIDFEEIDGVKKLRITDNGTGMTPDGLRLSRGHSYTGTSGTNILSEGGTLKKVVSLKP